VEAFSIDGGCPLTQQFGRAAAAHRWEPSFAPGRRELSVRSPTASWIVWHDCLSAPDPAPPGSDTGWHQRIGARGVQQLEQHIPPRPMPRSNAAFSRCVVAQPLRLGEHHARPRSGSAQPVRLVIADDRARTRRALRSLRSTRSLMWSWSEAVKRALTMALDLPSGPEAPSPTAHSPTFHALGIARCRKGPSQAFIHIPPGDAPMEVNHV
jgi:hypothetical protein